MARSLSVSVVTSCIGAIVNALSGLVTAAFLLRQLGLETFGIWALVVSTTSLLWLLDFGTTVAVGRLIAAGRAKSVSGQHDQAKCPRASLCGIGWTDVWSRTMCQSRARVRCQT